MRSINGIVGETGGIIAPRNEDEACRLAVFLELADQQAERGEGRPLIDYSGALISINVDIKRLMDAIKGALQ